MVQFNNSQVYDILGLDYIGYIYIKSQYSRATHNASTYIHYYIYNIGIESNTVRTRCQCLKHLLLLILKSQVMS